MEDQEIVALYAQRSEQAIEETKRKYGRYCTSIAYNILGSFEETEECIADVYLKAWESIPPTAPQNLKVFLGRITHNIALNRYRYNTAKKRSVFTTVLEELEITALEDPGDILEQKALATSISDFLRLLPPLKQKIFLLRYWYYDPVKTIAQETGLKEERVSTELYRMRKKLKRHLEQEGFHL